MDLLGRVISLGNVGSVSTSSINQSIDSDQRAGCGDGETGASWLSPHTKGTQVLTDRDGDNQLESNIVSSRNCECVRIYIRVLQRMLPKL